jgi:acyl-CoA synthetase (AMP-forming)/AMP-acid ligase II
MVSCRFYRQINTGIEIMTISEMLNRNARLFPDDVALIELAPDEGKRKEISWREFDKRANQIANALRNRGIKKGDKVIQLMRNSINWIETYFGIIRTGAWVVPLSFRFTSSDIKYCADISEAKMMIMDEEFIERVEKVKSQLVTIKDYFIVGDSIPNGWNSWEGIIAQSSSEAVPVVVEESDECGLYFTSGTTGLPKPILLTHKNMECAALAEQAHHKQTKEDNFILIPPLYHAGAKMHWFGSLLVGGCATLLKKVTPQIIFEVVHKERGTIVWLLVPWAHDVLSALDRNELKKEDYDLSCWRLMHIGAQPVPPSLVLRWRKYFPDMQYDNNYGLSESTGPGCIHLGLANRHKVDSIGKAGFGWEVRVVNDKCKDVARGEVGELIVRGCGVMKEYYKNPEMTAQTIIDGWLYTGDMAKMDDEDFIYLVDRKKDVVICGGENVYPVEVEEILHHHPKVYDVAVIGIPDERLGEVVAAVIDPKPNIALTKEEVMSFCEQQLPRYKRPRVIIFDKVPRSPTGKLEKLKLREKYCGHPTAL